MALINQIKPGGPQKGLTRWLIAPAPRMPEQVIQTMRPEIIGLPERWPMNPLYPQPGKRGASRPPADQTPETPTPAAGAGAGETGTTTEPPPIGGYPTPRPRYPVEIYDADGNPSTAYAPGEQCERPDGACFSYDFVCNAQSTTIAKVSPSIPSPFVIQHIQLNTDAGPGDFIYVQVLTAPDDDLSAPLTTTGTPVITDGSAGNSRVRAFLPAMDLWPAFYERRNGQHIKVTVYQLTLLVPRQLTVSISLLLIR